MIGGRPSFRCQALALFILHADHPSNLSPVTPLPQACSEEDAEISINSFSPDSIASLPMCDRRAYWTSSDSNRTFELVPSDYAMLKILTLSATGGDTIWASGYEIYDRLSPPMREMLKGLTAPHDAKFFLDEAERLGNPVRRGKRGSPLNHGSSLQAVHRGIRTNRLLSVSRTSFKPALTSVQL